jgi:outer membrane protein TolC
LPQIDVVAQYALFARYNYQDYFRTFQRNNGQLGVSIKIPLLVGSAPSGLAAQAETEIAKLRTEMGNTRGRVTLDAKKYYQDMKRAEGGRTVSKLDLEVAREQLSVLLAQLDEGRVPRTRVDEARYTEQEKWLGFYESEHTLERARLNLLRRTGALQTALR